MYSKGSEPEKNKEAQMDENEQQQQQAVSAEPLSQEALKKQDAERLLRSVDDKVGKFILRNKDDVNKGRSKNGNDW